MTECMVSVMDVRGKKGHYGGEELVEVIGDQFRTAISGRCVGFLRILWRK